MLKPKVKVRVGTVKIAQFREHDGVYVESIVRTANLGIEIVNVSEQPKQRANQTVKSV